ncbi:pentatricopeptide repeat-containing protein At1g77360, mitochondrial [Ricinus communis]|uniref:Pentatricopeptide repeat-containing protein, putative n=1 Tax=Ricinus communis TaxID=3988 RepID=B9S1R1_RICCO|nr:pentatricopeptide repeat-containing protein At1g77360, mitochondrial [Ricinus communis]XP_025013226.1 pentatricopeptide repeat-containing protein At1g77360, mitochondrial [Ricinus communis]EEF42530.1 pentatricopeptide repeat-containing protein, putative [Ricinus communis]|eukprot:XP_025013225.1 pentatricopeptide repeat-containing protein At1g77360, mitochondrial [Ricinus communis]
MESTDEYSPHQSQSRTPKPKSKSTHSNGVDIDIDISQSARTLSDILTRVSPHDMESALSSTGINLTCDIIHEVLKLSYSNPASAVEFFRWAGRSGTHTPYSWNLMVDLLGKNQLFEAMWDAIRSMKQENVLSMATFASVFGSYCKAGSFSEAIMSFDIMDKYGIQQDVIAVNSLLSAICNEDNQTIKAVEFFDRIKLKIPPDGDTYAILLEGWEKEGNAAKAKNIFGEMVIHVGWSPENMPAYNAFLNLLVRESQTDDAFDFLRLMKEKGCLPGLKFYSDALDMLLKRNDVLHAVPMWDIMVDTGLMPNLLMYNSMIGLLCNNNDIDNAFRLFDDMVFHGAFPDFLTYKMIFRCLVKNKKVSQAASFFHEMIKNENPPTHLDCAAAITMFMGGDDPEMAIEIWNYMVDDQELPLDESANALLVGLGNLGRLSEVSRFAEDMLDRRINIHESTMAKLKASFYKEGRSSRDRFDSLSRKWKAS